jgi:nucleolar complex protein 2
MVKILPLSRQNFFLRTFSNENPPLNDDDDMARGRISKATKKFESKHLTKTLETRKIQKRNKDKYNKDRNDIRKAAARAIVQNELVQKKAATSGKGTLFDEMTIDEFLESGGATDVALPMDIDKEPAEGSTVELAQSHKAGLDKLKEKDPSFYEFLKQNDRELLEFDPDVLVVEEDEEAEDTVEGGLTLEILSKWEKLLVEEKSLGTLKKLLIAVRSAAANVSGEEPTGGNAKYVLTDPEGIYFKYIC